MRFSISDNKFVVMNLKIYYYVIKINNKIKYLK